MCRRGAKLRWNVKWNEAQGYDELQCSAEMQSYNELPQSWEVIEIWLSRG